MNKRPKLKLEEHEQLGAELQVMRDRLVAIAAQVENAYGTTKAVSRAAYKALRTVDVLRSELDSRVFAEHRERDGKTNALVYYRSERRDEGAHDEQA